MAAQSAKKDENSVASLLAVTNDATAETRRLLVDPTSGALLTLAYVGSGTIINPTANFTRPADTTAYAVGDLVANNTTAGSVVPLSWTVARVAAGNFFIRRARLKKSTTSLTNASFRVHFYGASPTCANGDNGAWSTTESTYYGAMDVTANEAFTDASKGLGTPNNGSEIAIALASGQVIYGLIEARAAYTPGNAEVFTVELEVYQN